MKTIQKNTAVAELITGLKKLSIERDVALWKRIASDLERSTRQRRVVNVYKIAKNTADNDYVIVPGKVLGVGEIDHKVTVAALAFSDEAREKIGVLGKALTIDELMRENPAGKKIRILG